MLLAGSPLKRQHQCFNIKEMLKVGVKNQEECSRSFLYGSAFFWLFRKPDYWSMTQTGRIRYNPQKKIPGYGLIFFKKVSRICSIPDAHHNNQRASKINQ
jgi:hypothetical protein